MSGTIQNQNNNPRNEGMALAITLVEEINRFLNAEPKTPILEIDLPFKDLKDDTMLGPISSEAFHNCMVRDVARETAKYFAGYSEVEPYSGPPVQILILVSEWKMIAVRGTELSLELRRRESKDAKVTTLRQYNGENIFSKPVTENDATRGSLGELKTPQFKSEA